MNPKIYIWERSSIVALDLKNILLKAAFEARIIEIPEDVLSYAADENPGLFILCPDMDFTTAQKLISIIQSINISIIILSTISEAAIKEELKNCLVPYKILSKPFDEKVLINCIRDSLNERYKVISRRSFDIAGQGTFN